MKGQGTAAKGQGMAAKGQGKAQGKAFARVPLHSKSARQLTQSTKAGVLMWDPTTGVDVGSGGALRQEGRHFAVYLFVHTKHSQKAGPFSVALLKMDLPFHNRLAYSRVHRRSAGHLGGAATTRARWNKLASHEHIDMTMV